EKTVTQFCRKLAAERPLKDIRDEYNYPKKKGIKDECSRLLEASTMKSRRGFAIQRLMNAMRQAHADGWRSEERFSRNAETDLVCRLLLEKKKEHGLVTVDYGIFSGSGRLVIYRYSAAVLLLRLI